MIHSSTGGEIKTVTTQYKVSAWPPTYVGKGFSVGGTIVGLRAHTVQDSANKYNRYLVLQVDVDEVRNRIFNEKGEEVDALYDTSNTKAKGHLNHFNTTDNDPNRLTIDQLLSRLGGSTLPDNLYNEERSKLHPYVKSRFEFWGDVNFMKPFDFKVGQSVKLKTKSDSIFVESVGKSETATNYRGENVIGGWTSKISNANNTKVAEQSHKPLPGEDKEGVDDSEWD